MAFVSPLDDLVSEEIKDIIIADVVLTIAFALVWNGGIYYVSLGRFLLFLPIAFVAVTLSFVLHEYMHKIVAQRFGATAAFRTSQMGLIITLMSGVFGFLIGIPGATMIYANRFTRQEEGYVSLAGPLTNFVIFVILYGIFITRFPSASPFSVLVSNVTGHNYVEFAIAFALYISVFLAFFNMLPIYPLDGSKVLRWNRTVYIVMTGIIFIFLYMVVGSIAFTYAIMLIVLALFFSFLYSGVRLF